MRLIGLGAKGRHRIRKKLTAWGVAAAVIAGMSVGFMASSAPASAAVQGGTCNAFTGASALTAAYTDSSVTVPACGPQPMYHNNTGPRVYPYPGGRYTLGYQCVEFSERYLYYKFHVTAKASANGEQVVDNYYSWYPSIFTKYSNGAVGHAPAKGDVLSFSNYSNFNGGSRGNGGHTAVVQSSSVNSSGNGSITIVEENGGKYATNGSQVLTVSGWKVLYSPHPYVKWLHYKGSAPTPPVTPPVSSAPGVYHAGKQVSIVSQATTGVSGHSGPTNIGTAVGPNYAKNSPIWIVCYVTGQQIRGPYGTEAIWDLSDNGWYYSDAWLWTGTNGTAVPACSLKTVSTVSQATTGVNGHTGPGNQYPVAPNSNKAKGASFQIACYVDGQSIKGPYGTEAIWDLAVGGWYYSDAWLWTGTNGAAVRHC